MDTENTYNLPDDESYFTSHKNNIPWHKAPLPRRLHFCKVWTYGDTTDGVVERCACGAIRFTFLTGRGPWTEKNGRRKK